MIESSIKRFFHLKKIEMRGIMKRRLHLEHWQVIALYLLIYDLVAVNASYFLALWLRFDLSYSEIPPEYLQAFLKFAPIYSIFCLILFWVLKLYKTIWRFASYSELSRIIIASIITTIFQIVGITVLFIRMPFSYYFWGAILQFIFILGSRFGYRFYLMLAKHYEKDDSEKPKNKVMIIGAGSAGQILVRDIQHGNYYNDYVVCIIDDNPNKWNRMIENVPVVGGRDVIAETVVNKGINKIYLAIPSATRQEQSEILNICKETGCQLKNLPGLYQLANDEIKVSRLKDVAVEDLLGRDPITVDLTEVFEFLSGKTILVTGGGGSIGSELCRQIATHNPKRLVIFDIYENNVYDIQQELKRKYGNELDLVCLIGSVQDSRRIWQVFEEYQPDIVFHAAAHKHVPLMEVSPCEAVKNNAIGTYKTAYAAAMNGTKRFVLISTDKAVNPTNVMGATKRMCEMVIQTFDEAVKKGTVSELPEIYNHNSQKEKLNEFKPVTQYVAVRFGNVLGSNGSVIPLFKKQIANGGPVTVTHPNIIRYFMTIPEAVSLVLQAGYYAKGGEIFVLDMGEPVKIDDLARNLIKLSGSKPDIDIEVKYTGLRPGEKLYEEKLMAEEGLEKTKNKLIHIGKPIAFDKFDFVEKLKEIMNCAYRNDQEQVINYIKQIVVTFQPNND